MTERAQQSFSCPAHSEWVCCLQSFFENIPSLPAWSLHTFCFCFYNVIIKYNIVIKVYLNTISLLYCEEWSQLRQQNRRRFRKMFTWLVTNAIIQLSHFHSQRKGLQNSSTPNKKNWAAASTLWAQLWVYCSALFKRNCLSLLHILNRTMEPPMTSSIMWNLLKIIWSPLIL